jgi:signal peptidase I
LAQQAVEVLNRHTEVVDSITPIIEEQGQGLYPVNKHTGWSVDNYGPLWIPKCGETIVLTLENLPFYERPIAVYEGNDLQVRDGRIYINGKETTEYTFTMDYYWMQGDNRHNSLDSRFWGFVPEDHIVGKPILIWLSLDKDRGWFDGKIRWNRMFRMVEDYK